MSPRFRPSALLLLTTALCAALAAACGDDGGSGDSGMDGGLGGEGAPCATFTDCRPELDCIMSVCRATDGSLGSPCVYTESCMTGLYCAPNRTCQPGGSGGVGTECELDGDCAPPNVCDLVGGALRCTPGGAGDIGDPCASVVDCRAGLFCVAGMCSAEPGGGSDGGVDGGDAGADGGDTGPPPPPPTCLAYCGLVIGNCSDNGQYGSFADCMGHCENTGGWGTGSRNDTSGNTVACRTTYAERAAGDPGANCAAAGPTGAGVCGSLCEVYCGQVAANCTGGNAIAFDPDCLTACAAYPAAAPNLSAMGDSVQCRLYHSGILAGGNPGLHCPHAGPEPTAFCVDL